MKGKLYLIPCPIVEGNFDSLPPVISNLISVTSHFVTERARTSRRFIKSLCPEIKIDELTIFELNKNIPAEGLYEFLEVLNQGVDVGVMSEAGCPGVADPGNLAVQWCHQHDVEVVPFVGPSSILLALMGSGLNGQNFAFNGYLPNKKPELIKKLRELENVILKQNQTQIFMDAPYRNTFLLDNCLKALNPKTKLCIACDLDSETVYIKTKRVQDWKATEKFHKRPAIFLIGK